MRRAIGYVRVSTDMQAAEGLSLEAQRAAIAHHCAAQGLVLVDVFEDVASGGKDDRPGLRAALDAMQCGDVLVALKFDRLSRSIRHFCELYERYFADGKRELQAVREPLGLHTSMGRVFVKMLLTFAEWERDAAGERTRETIRHVRAQGFHWGKVPYGWRAVAAPANPRFKVLVREPGEQEVIERIRRWSAARIPVREMAAALNEERRPSPQGQRWTPSSIYGLRTRLRLVERPPRPERWHDDHQLKERLVELRGRGLSPLQLAGSLNTEGWLPAKGQQFTSRSVRGLLSRVEVPAYLSPRRYLEQHLLQLRRRHLAEQTESSFCPPSYPQLAQLLTEVGFRTPRGHCRWWPAQIPLLLEGRFDSYYRRPAPGNWRPDLQAA